MENKIESEFAEGTLSSQIIMSMTHGLVIVDTHGKFIFWNQPGKTLVGMGPSDRSMEEWSSHYGLFELDGISRIETENLPLARALKGEVVSGREIFVKNKDRPKGIYLRVDAAPLKTADGSTIGAFAVLSDFTHERFLAQQLLQSQKMDAIGQLAGGIAHDFNNKLAAMTLALSELTKRCTCCDAVPSELAILKKLVEQSASLTRQILAFSRRQTLNPTVFDLNEYLRTEMSILSRLVGAEVEIVSRLSPSEARIRFDQVQLDQVLFNLAVNARDAMPEGGTLIIETEILILEAEDVKLAFDLEPGAYCVLTVSDTGVGIKKDDLDRIMEPFFTTKTTGTGLGLSTVHGIVRQSGGYIRVYSEINKGTTFRVYLPISDLALSTPEIADRGSARPRKADSLRILLVDDEPELLALTANILRASGYEVISLDSGKKAIEYAEGADRLDLLLTDTVMPGFSGRQLERQLLGKFPELKTIYMSGYSHEVITRKGIIDSDIHFIQKPFSVGSLDELIQSLFQG